MEKNATGRNRLWWRIRVCRITHDAPLRQRPQYGATRAGATVGQHWRLGFVKVAAELLDTVSVNRGGLHRLVDELQSVHFAAPSDIGVLNLILLLAVRTVAQNCINPFLFNLDDVFEIDLRDT